MEDSNVQTFGFPLPVVMAAVIGIQDLKEGKKIGSSGTT